MSKKFQKSKLKVPKFLLQEIIQDKELYKAILIYLNLKPIFHTGVFIGAKKRVKELSSFYSISPRAWAYKIKKLEENNFVKFNKRGDLILCSWVQFFENFGIKKADKRAYKFYRLKNIYDLDLLSRVLITQENFNKQEKAIQQKLFNREILETRQIEIIKKIKEIDSDVHLTKDKDRHKAELILQIKALELRKRTRQDDTEFKKLKRNGALEKMYVQNLIEADKFRRSTPNVNEQVNFDVSVSCQKISQLFGTSSASAGYYWEKRLEEFGYLEKKRREIFIFGHSLSRLQWAEEILHHYFKAKDGRGIFRRLNNHLQIKPLVTA